MTPFLTSAQEGFTQPLAGAPQDAELFQCMVAGKMMQHYSNIHRVSHLASTHPLVHSVMPHNINNVVHQFDAQGRCTKLHQSPWDLRITLTGSLHMLVGCTVYQVKHDLLAFWWMPVYGGWTEKLKSIGEAVFFRHYRDPAQSLACPRQCRGDWSE